MSQRKKVVLLGATGSIGRSALKVIRQHADRLQLVGAAANRSVEKLAAIAEEFELEHVALYDEATAAQARNENLFPSQANLHSGASGLDTLATLQECDLVLAAMVGTQGLSPALKCLQAGKTLAVANKEILVMAGKFIMQAAQENGAALIPVDSEHNALFQCLGSGGADSVEKVIITASGGRFRDVPLADLPCVTVAEALEHPNWDMGPKVTIDSATMANKGLEMIEARWLFGLEPSQIEAVIHPQSIVHSMAQYVDGSIIAQMNPPDMAFAVQNALLHPERGTKPMPTLDFAQAMQLDFQPMDLQRYPCLALARQAMEAGGIAPAVFNAANEVAVDAFVSENLKFTDIAVVIEKTLQSIDNREPTCIEEVLEYDQKARSIASSLVQEQTLPTPT